MKRSAILTLLIPSALLLALTGCHHSHHAYRERCDDDVIVVRQYEHHDDRWRDHRHNDDYHDYRGSHPDRRDGPREYTRSNDDRGGRDRFEKPRGRGR